MNPSCSGKAVCVKTTLNTEVCAKLCLYLQKQVNDKYCFGIRTKTRVTNVQFTLTLVKYHIENQHLWLNLSFFPKLFLSCKTPTIYRADRSGKESVQQWQTHLWAPWDPYMFYEHLEYAAHAVWGPNIFKYEALKKELTLRMCAGAAGSV